MGIFDGVLSRCYCLMAGHAWDTLSRYDSIAGWLPTGMERCENCGKERRSLCYYCKKTIGSDTRVYLGHRCCRTCFDEKDSIHSAFGYAHGDKQWTNEKK